MKTTAIYLRLILGVGIAVFILVSSMRASLEDILAPLSVADLEVAPIATIAKPLAKEAVPTTNAAPLSLDNQTALSLSAQEALAEPAEAVVNDPILGSDIRDALTLAMEDALRPEGDLALIPLRELPDLSSYSRPFYVNILNQPGRLTRGHITLAFQVENEKGVLGQWDIPFRTHLYRDVWVARTMLRSGELASASDFEVRQIDLLNAQDVVPATLEILLRHEYARDVKPGKALTWNDLTERSLIRKGDVVEVSAVQGLLAITVRAIARQDGGDGDLIVLKNIDSAKEFSARVTGESRAEIVF